MNVQKEKNEYKIVGAVVDHKNEFFSNPICSTKLKIFESDGKEKDNFFIFDVDSIVAKIICLPNDMRFVFVPMIHTVDSLDSK